MAPWLLPRIDDWAAVSSLGAVKPRAVPPTLKARPALALTAHNRFHFSSRSRLPVPFTCTFHQGLRSSSHIPSFTTATRHILLLFPRTLTSSPFDSQASNHSFFAASRYIELRQRQASFKNTPPHNSSIYTNSSRYQSSGLSCSLLSHFAASSTIPPTSARHHNHEGDPILDTARAGSFCQRPDNRQSGPLRSKSWSSVRCLYRFLVPFLSCLGV